MFAWLDFLTPIVKVLCSWWFRNEQKTAETVARWQRLVLDVNKRATTAVDMSLGYDKIVKEQDERMRNENSDSKPK